MTLVEISAYLQAQGFGITGTDLFLGGLPVSPVVATALTELPTSPTERVFDGVLWERPRLRVEVRDTTYLAARTKAEDLRQALLALRGTVLSGALYIDAETGPVALYDRDAQLRPIMGFTAEFKKQFSLLGD